MKIKADQQFLELLPAWKSDAEFFARMMALQGEVFRQLEGRETLRIELQGKNFFIKKHRGIGWGEIFKNLLQLRLPVLGARNEIRALNCLEANGVLAPKVMAFGFKTGNPAKQHSFVITEAVADSLSLEEVGQQRTQLKLSVGFKRNLIKQVATMTRKMHLLGMNHRDCYLCHFLLPKESLRKEEAKLYLIDLHRAQIRRKVPRRWLVKDLAGLYFSSMDFELTRQDKLRFLQEYFRLPAREVLTRFSKLLKQVEQRALKIYERDKRR
jgi:heptose I phosphotransferase